MRRKGLPYTKTVRAKGKTYLYFDTGEKDARGKAIYKPLPSQSDKSFGSVYAGMLGHRAKRDGAEKVLTVTDMVRAYQESPKFTGLAASTQKLYRIYQGRFAQMLPTAPAGQIERADIVALFDKMAKTPGAANMLLASISALYRWGRRGGHVSNRPADDIDPNEIGEHDPWPAELLNAALVSDNRTVRVAVHLLYYTAQRIGDVAAMRWSMISDGAIVMTPQKTKKSRGEMIIPLHPALARELDRHERDLRTILLNDEGRAFNERTLRKVVQDWAKGQGNKIVPHGLRKNAVNALLEVGCTVAQTAAISGQSFQMVEHYARMRNQSKLARSAMKLWGGTESESSNHMENSSEKGGKA